MPDAQWHPKPCRPVECASGDALSFAAADASARQPLPMAASTHSATTKGGQQFCLNIKLRNRETRAWGSKGMRVRPTGHAGCARLAGQASKPARSTALAGDVGATSTSPAPRERACPGLDPESVGEPNRVRISRPHPHSPHYAGRGRINKSEVASLSQSERGGIPTRNREHYS
jgi:hypothetical protein